MVSSGVPVWLVVAHRAICRWYLDYQWRAMGAPLLTVNSGVIAVAHLGAPLMAIRGAPLSVEGTHGAKVQLFCNVSYAQKDSYSWCARLAGMASYVTSTRRRFNIFAMIALSPLRYGTPCSLPVTSPCNLPLQWWAGTLMVDGFIILPLFRKRISELLVGWSYTSSGGGVCGKSETEGSSPMWLYHCWMSHAWWALR
jgi:hypothetical protein